MNARLLLVAAEPPAIGGLSTASFALFRMLRAQGADVHYVTAIAPVDAAHVTALLSRSPGTGAPEPDVSVCALAGTLDGGDPGLAAIIERVDPAIVLGFGLRAAGAAKAAAPARRVVFVTGTCKEAEFHVVTGRAPDAVGLAQALAQGGPPPRRFARGEARCVEACDLIVTHSPQTLAFMEGFYPAAVGRIFPRAVSFAEWISADVGAWRASARPFDARDIDVLFVASDWSRVEKNYALVRAIARRLPERSVHVIGYGASPDRHIIREGFLASRAEVCARMGRARVVACPSLIDAAPGVLFEGSVLGCNLVASRTCGNWELCHPDLLAPSLDAEAFAECIRRGLERPYDDRRQRFLDAGGYAELLVLLEAFAEPFVSEAVS